MNIVSKEKNNQLFIEEKELELPLFSDEIFLNDKMQRYAKLDGWFQCLAYSQSVKLKKIYKSMKNIDNVIENIADKIIELYEEAASYCVQYMINNYGVYTYTEKDFIRIDKIIPVIDDIEEAYMDILMEKEQKERYREIRKQSRSRMVGISIGGGVSGAVNSAIQAGVYNAATGMAHSAFNSVGNLFSAGASALDKFSLYHNDSVCESLQKAMEADIYDWSALMYVYLYKEGIQLAGPTEEKQHIADSVFQNLKNIDTNSNLSSQKVAFEIFQNNPYKAEYYDYCLKRFPNEHDNLMNIALYLNVSLLFQSESIVKTLYTDRVWKYEDKLLDFKNKLELYNEYTNLNYDSILEDINERLKQFDISARTYYDVLYESREQCEAVKLNHAQLKKDFNNVEFSKLNEKECVSLKQEVASVKEKYHSNVIKIFLTEIEQRIKQIHQKEDEKVIRAIFIDTNVLKEEEVSKSIKKISELGRTEDKEKYITALKTFNNKNVRYMEKNIKPINSMLFVAACFLAVVLLLFGLFPISLIIGFILIWRVSKLNKAKDIWKTLTMDETVIHPSISYIKKIMNGKKE